MIGGLEEVTEGNIFIAGKDVTDLPPALRDTSMMFQSFALFPHRTVFQNVEFSLKMKGMEKTRARPAGVGNARNGRADHFSRTGGRAIFPAASSSASRLARALISRPTVLLLDEPLGSLDFNLRQAMMIELKKVQRELNITFIMVTHSQQEAMSLADKVIVMSDAVIQQIGSSREVHENPQDQVRRRVYRQQQSVPGQDPFAQRLDRVRRVARNPALRAGCRRASGMCRSARKCGSRYGPT